jgi:hypothetical protein
MLSFKNFLTESEEIIFKTYSDESISDIADVIIKNCKPFLNEINNEPTTYIMWRGTKELKNILLLRKTVRLNRRPRDMDQSLFIKVDKWFKKNMGIPFRSQGLFVSGSSTVAKIFGFPNIIFPIGNFEYCWSPIYDDLTDNIVNRISSLKTTDKEEFSYLKMNGSNIKDYHLDEILSDGKFVLNKKLKLALTKYERNEIIISCKEYFILDAKRNDVYPKILGEIENKLW